jgi:hypothetical protein
VIGVGYSARVATGIAGAAIAGVHEVSAYCAAIACSTFVRKDDKPKE